MKRRLVTLLFLFALFNLSITVTQGQSVQVDYDCQRLDIWPTDRRMSFPPAVWAMAVSSDGVYLGTVENGRLRLFNTDTLAEVKISGLTGQPASRFVWSSNGERLAVAGKSLEVWDLETGSHTVIASNWNLYAVDWSTSEQYIAARDASGLYVWDVTTNKLTGSLYVQVEHSGYSATEHVRQIGWKPNTTLLTIALETKVLLWDVTQAVPVEVINREPGHRITNFAWTPDGSILALPDEITQEIELWNSDSWQVDRVLTPRLGGIDVLSWSKGDDQLAVAVRREPSCTLFVWDTVSDPPTPRAIGTNPGLISNIAWTPDGKYLFSALMDGSIYKWEVSTATLAGMIPSEELDSAAASLHLP